MLWSGLPLFMRRTEPWKKADRGGVSPRSWLISLLACVSLCGGIFVPAHGRADLLDLLEIPAPVPARDVSLTATPPVAWKKIWDEARYLTRTGDFPGATKKYEELLDRKGNIAAARWEYGRLLLKAGHWEKAARTMELLVESAPDRVEYLNGLGLALRKLKHFNRALDLFSKAHANDPDDLTAMAGLAQGLVEVGRKNEAFPLFAAIFAKRPDDIAIHRALANLAFELGELETARNLMMPLLKGHEADLDTLLMTARIFTKLNNEAEATGYWQRCLRLDPGNREARGRLALYFEKIGQPGEAIPHLLALLADDPLNGSLLSRICRIYVQTDRFALALPYFERYVALRPGNLDGLLAVGKGGIAADGDMISLYRRLLAVTPDDLEALDDLADDLLACGDPETALFLWEHAARLDPERVEVYRELVALLEKLGHEQRLAEVLAVLHRLAPGEIKVVSRLANLKVAQGELTVGLAYYNELEKAGYAGDDLFAGRGALLEELGRLAPALADYRRLLLSQPDRQDIRRRSLVLAGKLGENQFLAAQVRLLEAGNSAGDQGQDLLLAARAFAEARDFARALSRYQQLLGARTETAAGQNSGERVGPPARAAQLALVDLYRAEGLVFEAEQVLRQMFLAGDGQAEILERLFDLALADHSRSEAAAGLWLGQYLAQNPGSRAGVFMQARLAAAAGDYDEAEYQLTRMLSRRETGDQPNSPLGRNDDYRRRAGLLLAETLIAAGELGKAERWCRSLLGGGGDQAVLVLVQKIRMLDGEAEDAADIFTQLLDVADDNAKLLRLAELYRQYGLTASQVLVADKVLLKAPGSLAAAFLAVEGRVADGRSREALRLLEGMAKMYPGDSAIILRLARIHYLNGRYASALQLCDGFIAGNPARLDAYLLKADCLVALDAVQAAESMIQELFPVGTEALLQKKLAAAGRPAVRPAAPRTFLEMLTFSSGKPRSLAAELMDARHLLDNSTKAKRQLNFIAVPLYAMYRWEEKLRQLVTPA
jgi:tetratricopeptide (TPR) repeat protein